LNRVAVDAISNWDPSGRGSHHVSATNVAREFEAGRKTERDVAWQSTRLRRMVRCGVFMHGGSAREVPNPTFQVNFKIT